MNSAPGGGAPRLMELPGGVFDAAGRLHRQLMLNPLTGRDEELLAEAGGRAAPEAVTEILARAIVRLGDLQPVTSELVRGMLVVDRQFTLLKLRELTFGPRVDAHLRCPWPGCGKKMTVSFSTADVPVEVPEALRPIYEVHLSEPASFVDTQGQRRECLRFRLPVGRDQEALAQIAYENEARAATLLLARCLETAPGEDARALVDGLSARARAEIEAAMMKVAPRLELTMDMVCPECEREASIPFLLQDFLLGELRTSGDLLRREVHYLAYHYHWSESEILSLPRDKRRAYIRTLAEEIEKANGADA